MNQQNLENNIDGDHHSYADSDQFEEDDSVCSFASENESLVNNWRGWRKNSSSPAHISSQKAQPDHLVRICARSVATYFPFEVVEQNPLPVPEEVQKMVAFYSFPTNEEDIRLYSCLAGGNADEFNRGDQLYHQDAVTDCLQIGFRLTASVIIPTGHSTMRTDPATLPGVPRNTAGGLQALQGRAVVCKVSLSFDRRRIITCWCTCNEIWCCHIVAVCLYRIYKPDQVRLRAPVSESLSKLTKDDLQKFAQYLICSLNTTEILPAAQEILDKLLAASDNDLKTQRGAPDLTSGGSLEEIAAWCFDKTSLEENVKKILQKFCVPQPVVYSDPAYLTSILPATAEDYNKLLKPLRSKEPEGIWNLLSIIRELFRRRDNNAIPLLEIVTSILLEMELVVIWWYSVALSLVLPGSKSAGTHNSAQHNHLAAANFCDEMVDLWRLAALDPTLSPLSRRHSLHTKLVRYHRMALDKAPRGLDKMASQRAQQSPASGGGGLVGNQRGGRGRGLYGGWNGGIGAWGGPRDSGSVGDSMAAFFSLTNKNAFPGFKPAIACCRLSWEDYPVPGLGPQGSISIDTSASLKSHRTNHQSTSPLQRQRPATSSGRRTRHVSIREARCRPGTSSAIGPSTSTAICPSTSTSLGSMTSATIGPSTTTSLGPMTLTTIGASTSKGIGSMTSINMESPTSTPIGPSTSDDCANEDAPGGDVERDSISTTSSICGGGTSSSEGFCEPGDSTQLNSGGIDDASTVDCLPPLPMAEAPETREDDEASSSEEEGLLDDIQMPSSPQELLFCRCEALYYHGYPKEAAQLAISLAHTMLASQADLYQQCTSAGLHLCTSSAPAQSRPSRRQRSATSVQMTVGGPNLPSTSQIPSQPDYSLVASHIFSRTLFLTTCLLEECSDNADLALQLCLFALCLPRPPSRDRSIEVKLFHQELELIGAMTKVPVSPLSMERLRLEAIRLKNTQNAILTNVHLPYSLAFYLFEQLSSPRPATGPSPSAGSYFYSASAPSNPPSAHHFWSHSSRSNATAPPPPHPTPPLPNRTPDDINLGFDAVVSVLGMRSIASESSFPLVVEGQRKQRHELAAFLFVVYKEDVKKLSTILGQLLDRKIHPHFKAPPLHSCLSLTVPQLMAYKEPSMPDPPPSPIRHTSQPIIYPPTPPTQPPIELVPIIPVEPQRTISLEETVLHNECPVASTSTQRYHKSASAHELPKVTSSSDLRVRFQTSKGGRAGPSRASASRDTDSSAVDDESDHNNNAWEGMLRCTPLKSSRNKLPSVGMAAVDSSAPETTSSDNSPTLIRRHGVPPRQDIQLVQLPVPPADMPSTPPTSFVVHDSDSSCGEHSSDSDGQIQPCPRSSPSVDNNPSTPPLSVSKPSTSSQSTAPSINNQSSPSLLSTSNLSLASAASNSNLSLASLVSNSNPTSIARNRGNQSCQGTSHSACPEPNRPTESMAYHMFDLANTLNAKAGGSTANGAVFNHVNAYRTADRNLQLCAFQIGLYALGLYNMLNSSWQSRTYSSHVAWITAQVTENGVTAACILLHTWKQHLNPAELANIADKAAKGRDTNMVMVAAELCLACLSECSTLNHTEITRALQQCKEQSNEMLERALRAVENGANHSPSGVMPEIFFDLAHYWYQLGESVSSAHIQAPPVFRQHQPPTSQPHLPYHPSYQQILQNPPYAVNPVNPVPIYHQHMMPNPNNQQNTSQHYYSSYFFHPPNPGQAPAFLLAQQHQYPLQVRSLPPSLHMSPRPPALNHFPIAPHQSYPLTPFQHQIQHQMQPVHPNLQHQQVSLPPQHYSPAQFHQQERYLLYIQKAFSCAMRAIKLIHIQPQNTRTSDTIMASNREIPQRYNTSTSHTTKIKWTLEVARLLGVAAVHEYCNSVVTCIQDHHLLRDISKKIIQLSHVFPSQTPNQSPSPLDLTSPPSQEVVNKLVNKVHTLFRRDIDNRLQHIGQGQSEWDELVEVILTAQETYKEFPSSNDPCLNWNSLLLRIQKNPKCKTDLWQRIVAGINTRNLS